MKNFPIVAAAIEAEYAFVWIAMRTARFHHPLDGFCGVARVAARLIAESGCRNRIFDGQMTETNILFIEHNLLGDVGRPLVPDWVRVIEQDGYNGSRTNVGTTTSDACGTDKFQADMEI
jgi:hypothetical protein